MSRYKSDDICIVGVGCILPEAKNIEEFWNNLMESRCSIGPIPKERWDKDIYYSKDKKEEDKTYSHVAAYVEDSILKRNCKDLGLKWIRNNRLQIMAVEASRQALLCLNKTKLQKKKVDIFLGCGDLDEILSLNCFYQNKEDWIKELPSKNSKEKDEILREMKRFSLLDKVTPDDIEATIQATSMIKLIKDRFNIKGEGCLIDAACASSLAAIDTSISRLKNHEADLIITGGVESHLGPSSFVLFSKNGAMSKDKCLPFDKRTDGLSLGEGSVIFALQRIEDAIKDKNKIYGVIRGCGSSSDGKNSSIFSPSVEGQVMAYKKAYSGFEDAIPDYIECHGTGTKIGDPTEVSSLNAFFKDKKIPIGSVKSLIGHTRSAAGAAGLLKCLLCIKNRIIPPSKYHKNPLPNMKKLFLNKKIIKLNKKNEPLQAGVSSFGFGNINFHLFLEEYKEESEIIEKKTIEDKDNTIAIVGYTDISDIDPYEYIKKNDLRIPPKSIEQTDILQLKGIIGALEAFKDAKINLDENIKRNTVVISASRLFLNHAKDFGMRVRHLEFNKILQDYDKTIRDDIMSKIKTYSKITEDTGAGILNNVIAGRICNYFDLKGKNFNVDADSNTILAAMNIAVQEIKLNNSLVLLFCSDDELNRKDKCIDRKKTYCLLLASQDYAKDNELEIKRIIKNISYEDV